MIGMGHYSASGAISEMDKLRKERLLKKQKATQRDLTKSAKTVAAPPSKSAKVTPSSNNGTVKPSDESSTPKESSPKAKAKPASSDNYFLKKAGYVKDPESERRQRNAARLSSSSMVRFDGDGNSLTTTSTSSTMWVENKLEKAKAQALKVIQQTLDAEMTSRLVVRKNLVHAADAAVLRYESRNERGASLSMKKYKAYRAQYDKSSLVIQRLQALYEEVAMGDSDDPTDRHIENTQKHLEFVEGHRKQVKSILDVPAQLRPHTDDELLSELATGQVQAFISMVSS